MINPHVSIKKTDKFVQISNFIQKLDQISTGIWNPDGFWVIFVPLKDHLSGFQTPLENQTIREPDTIWPFEYRTSPVFRWLLYFVVFFVGLVQYSDGYCILY